MNNNSRTQNTVKNISINLILYFLIYIAVFFSRTVFVKLLGNEYLSIAGLLTNVVTILSFTELGIGTASVYCLYKPLADRDYGKIKAYINFFKKLYLYVTAATLILGLALIPFLTKLVQMDEMSFSGSYITLVYALFVTDTAVSYLFIHKKLLLTADQKNYVSNIIQQSVHLIQLIVQIGILLFTRDYIVYLTIQIACTIVTNCITSVYVERKYSNIFRAEVITISNEEMHNVKKNIGSIFLYKVGAVALNGTDNIIISSFVKMTLVGICSNFVLVINSVNMVLMQCFNGIGASIGNHVVAASREDQETIFKQLDSFCSFLFSVCATCLACLLNPFVEVWLGYDYLLSDAVVYALVSAFYITGVNQIPSLYRTSYGLFEKARFYPLIAAILNILLSILLAKSIGLLGVFIATSIVKIAFFTVVDSSLLYRYKFEKSILCYWVPYIYRILVCILCIIVVNLIKDRVPLIGWNRFIMLAIICFVTSLFLSTIAYLPSRSFRFLLKRGYIRIKK